MKNGMFPINYLFGFYKKLIVPDPISFPILIIGLQVICLFN